MDEYENPHSEGDKMDALLLAYSTLAPAKKQRELALKLDNGTIIRDPGWRSVADVHGSFIGFVGRSGRTYGVIVDAETLVQVYPPPQPMDGAGTRKD